MSITLRLLDNTTDEIYILHFFVGHPARADSKMMGKQRERPTPICFSTFNRNYLKKILNWLQENALVSYSFSERIISTQSTTNAVAFMYTKQRSSLRRPAHCTACRLGSLIVSIYESAFMMAAFDCGT